MISVVFAIIVICLSVYSWGFVDANAPFVHIAALRNLVYHERLVSSGIYAGLFVLWYAWYVIAWHRNRLSVRKIGIAVGILVAVLVLSYPAFSNDIFNYIATAKVAYLYRENPYLVMPIDIPNEPMLRFMHAANKTALYGPVWIAMTVIPHVAGFGNLLATMYGFKLFVAGWYLLLVWLVWDMTKRANAVIFIALNPLVVIHTLVDGHNDVVMMALALIAFRLLHRKRYLIAAAVLLLSVGIKGATVILVPVFAYVWLRLRADKTVDWERVWTGAAISMFAVFFLSPIREEIYSWYFIWVLVFVALRKRTDILTAVSLGFTFGLPLRFLPFAYTGDWGGITPAVKAVVTAVPPVVAGIWYALRKKN